MQHKFLTTWYMVELEQVEARAKEADEERKQESDDGMRGRYMHVVG